MRHQEINFDGLVGPTHNYAGLSLGNVASMTHKRSVSSPRQAALQGVAKMKFLHDLGIPQAVLPPHERPHLPTLRARGYSGGDAEILAKVAKENPILLAQVSSSSAMWAANAATISPSADCADGRVHFTPANLISNLHRSIETATTERILRAIFPKGKHFFVHEPVDATPRYADEGAANHMRLAGADPNAPGLEIFVYGRSADANEPSPGGSFPRRQTLESAKVIQVAHSLSDRGVWFVKQSPRAIDAGAFHNDVVAVANGNVLLYHALAWENSARVVAHWRASVPDLIAVAASESEVPLTDAVSSYLFNSQLATLPDQSMALIAPIEARENPRTQSFVQKLLADGIISQVHYVDVRQSMHNGGGPACLRLRVVLTDTERSAAHQGVFFTEALHIQLKSWIERHYRDELHAEDLADPALLNESRIALDELTTILSLPPIYDFQIG